MRAVICIQRRLATPRFCGCTRARARARRQSKIRGRVRNLNASSHLINRETPLRLRLGAGLGAVRRRRRRRRRRRHIRNFEGRKPPIAERRTHLRAISTMPRTRTEAGRGRGASPIEAQETVAVEESFGSDGEFARGFRDDDLQNRAGTTGRTATDVRLACQHRPYYA
jgi:hypothetical protein